MTATTLTKNQKKTFRKDYTRNGKPETIIATVRFDDECGNGHNTLSVTGAAYESYCQRGEETVTHKSGKTLWMSTCGCIHDQIAEHFPELVPLIRFHLCSTDGPLHYIANTVYLAGERDHWGLLKGEFRQHTSRGQQNGGVAGVPNWELRIPKELPKDVYSHDKPAAVTLEWVASGITGEGKERELKSARSAACWPEATDEDLTAPGLRERLEARHAQLMAEFQATVESLGFAY